ncbi:MAG: lamin tail domain-containing protein, partial [Candidatus Parcubacteria bacterium]|nr:lamin tail domain-containing protein [Candidatus Parcubacteria bacterium]
PVAKDPDSTARIFDGAQTFNNKNDFAVTQTPTKGESNIITLTEEEKSKATQETAAKESEKTVEEKIVINELYPNPPGSDLDFEWIELKNIGTAEIDLTGWQIQDNSKKKYKVSTKDFSTTIVKPNEFFLIERKISGLALNNDKETIKLISPDDKTIQAVKYSEDENVPENVSYVPDENSDWFWTTTPTPNQENVLTKLNHAPEINLDCPKTALVGETITCDASDSFDLEDDDLTFTWQIEDQVYTTVIAQHQFKQKGTFSITLIVSDGQIETKEVQKIKITATTESTGSEVKAQTTKSTTTKSTTKKTTAKKIVSADLKNVKNLAIGTNVKTQGVVSVLPNVFGKTMMYVAGSGLQVYMSKASWPDLKIGDLVELNGTLSEALGEKRIKLTSNQDIKVIASQDPPEPKIITSKEINNDIVGYLVQISGQLLEKNGSKFFIKDVIGEAEVYLKTNAKISKENYAEGDNLKVTGILSRNNEEYRILPRSNEDIEKQIIAKPEIATKIATNKLGNYLLKFLIAAAVFITN